MINISVFTSCSILAFDKDNMLLLALITLLSTFNIKHIPYFGLLKGVKLFCYS